MSATTTEHPRHHGGWQRHRTQSRDVPVRAAAAHEAAAEVEAEARWLDDGGAAEETRDGVPFRYDGRPG